MRERTEADWAVDLGERHGLEAQVGDALGAHRAFEVLHTSTASYHRLDYQLVGPGGRLCELELKTKRQPLSAGWCQLRPDVDPADLFVIDELALRRIVDTGRYAFLLVRDYADRWCLWSAGHLVVASRVRHTRRITKTVPALKGKLVLDVSESDITTDLKAGLNAIAATVDTIEACWADIAPWPHGGRAG